MPSSDAEHVSPRRRSTLPPNHGTSAPPAPLATTTGAGTIGTPTDTLVGCVANDSVHAPVTANPSDDDAAASVNAPFADVAAVVPQLPVDATQATSPEIASGSEPPAAMVVADTLIDVAVKETVVPAGAVTPVILSPGGAESVVLPIADPPAALRLVIVAAMSVSRGAGLRGNGRDHRLVIAGRRLRGVGRRSGADDGREFLL